MKQINFTILVFLLFLSGIKAQETNNEEFTPSGKASAKIFTNAHTTYIDGENSSAFEVQRAYFGYGYSFSKEFSTKLTLDVGDPGTGKLQMTAYLKNALLEYHKEKLKVDFGLIGTYGFNVQEKQWGNRYVYKSFQDGYGFGPSADLGASAEYKFCDYFKVDAMLLNGEGYKNLQADNTYKGAIGATITPIKNLNIRVYYDNMSKAVAQSTMAFFAGYTADKFKVGAEYNLQQNNKFVDNQDMSGESFYATVFATKKVNFFARFDNLTSSKPGGATNGWNIAKDGQAYIVGVEYKPVKGVKISPNFQGWNPKLSGAAFVSSAYLNLEISF